MKLRPFEGWVDLVTKRRMALKHLLDLGLSPYHEDRLRRRLLGLKPLLSKHQVELTISNRLDNTIIVN